MVKVTCWCGWSGWAGVGEIFRVTYDQAGRCLSHRFARFREVIGA